MPVIKAKDGYTIRFSDHGSGKPVLLLHGWMMSRKVWHFQLPLSAEFRIITMDLRGHGESDASDFSYDACLSDITELLDILNIEGAIIVGWSMGSQITIKASRLLKDRLTGLILVGGTPCFCSANDYPYGLPFSEARGMAIRLKRDYKGTAGQFFKSMFSEFEAACIDLRDITVKTVSNLPPLKISLSALQELIATDLRAQLSGVSHPVLLVHGTEDKICLPGASDYMAEHLPMAKVEKINSSGHAPFLSAPEVFNSILTGFARTVNG